MIREVRTTLVRFEATGMDVLMLEVEDYDKLLNNLDSAVKVQREHTLEMLGELEAGGYW